MTTVQVPSTTSPPDPTTAVPTDDVAEPQTTMITPTTTTDGSGTGLLTTLGGLALAAAPVVMTIGFFTSPPQDSTSNIDYVTSMARAPFQAALSANFLHYAWVLWAVAALAMIGLFRGRPGRIGGTITAVLAAISSIQLSGLLLSDFYAVRVSQESGAAAAAAVEFDLGTSVDIWLWSSKVAALLVPAIFLFLARARIVSWWLAPLPLLSAGCLLLPLPAPVDAGLMIIMWAPAYLVARQLITGQRRGRP